MVKYIAILAAFLMVLVGCVAPVDESAWTNQAEDGVKKMTLVPVGPAPGGPFATILCPDDGNPATAEDIRRSTSTLLRNYELVDGDKVDRAGDTMTGTLNINPSAPNTQGLYVLGNGTMPAIYALGGATGNAIVADAGTNKDAIFATGNGTGFGIRGIGGATGGGGGRFEATASGSMGISAVGATGGGSGIVASGGAGGPGAEVYPGTSQTATAPQMSLYTNGFARFAGTDPNPTVDPGADNALHGKNIPKTWARIASRVADTDATRIKDGYNIALVTTSLFDCDVAFVRPMANAEYAVTITPMGGAPAAIYRTVGETVNGFTIRGSYQAAPHPDVQFQTAGQFDVAIHVMGSQ